MIAHVVGGWSQKIGDKSPTWAIADAIFGIPNVKSVTKHEWDGSLETLFVPTNHKRLVVTYSYGTAATMRALREKLLGCLADPRMPLPRFDFWVIIAGVNRVGYGQRWEDCWQIPAEVSRAVAVCTVYRNAVAGRLPVIPECCPIRGAASRDVGSDEAPPHADRLNINVFLEGLDHGNVVELPLTQELVKRAAITLLEEERNGGTA